MTSTSVRPDIILSRTPRQEFASADPTNFGDRYVKDIYGKPANNAPIVVLHETVGTASSAINTFQTPHPDEDDQVSYHSLIRQNGAVIYIVPPTKRAFGAGNSAYRGSNGIEAVKTHRLYPSSVNNFAYHISLESPEDGHNNALTHSGYTEAQYQSLAWLVAQTDVPADRIVTHKIVDRSGSRIDPRSFDDRKFLALLRPYLQAMQDQGN
ncbi:MAG: peptidoglycan recognition protein family protein [Drouetiella hepatica Uher 2000/2452]|uniref:N-acetylmuramoyl-L-alanine amidase n=1 Tax=Drouetiella hepatica Uher 2000/2452 TaxID=904376 RepID=A0A951Q8U0_9CYAN|nr:peptidoglycan recognition protein family protein [Drouetiella hepatica Uher 2000/2452]